MSDSKQDCRIWVGLISKDVTERELKDKFGTFGEVTEIKYVTSGRYDNYAFIQFDNRDSADQAMAKGSSLDFGDKPVRVGTANAKPDDRRRNRSRSRSNDRRRNRSPSEERPRSSFYGRQRSTSRTRSVQVRVSNLPSDMTWQELKRLGGDYGTSVNFARTWRDRDGVSGILEFTDKRDGQKVIAALDGKKMEGCDRRLRLELEH